MFKGRRHHVLSFWSEGWRELQGHCYLQRQEDDQEVIAFAIY